MVMILACITVGVLANTHSGTAQPGRNSLWWRRGILSTAWLSWTATFFNNVADGLRSSLEPGNMRIASESSDTGYSH